RARADARRWHRSHGAGTVAAVSRPRRAHPEGELRRGGGHLPQLLLEVGDLVPQPGRELELELLGGRVHLVAEVLDELGEVRGGCPTEALARRRPGRGGLAPALLALAVAALEQLLGVDVLAGEHVGDVPDALAQRGGVDAVLG